MSSSSFAFLCTRQKRQVIVFAVGSIAAFDNHALGELDMVPNSCLTLKDNSDGPVTTDELGFDEL